MLTQRIRRPLSIRHLASADAAVYERSRLRIQSYRHVAVYVDYLTDNRTVPQQTFVPLPSGGNLGTAGSRCVQVGAILLTRLLLSPRRRDLADRENAVDEDEFAMALPGWRSVTRTAGDQWIWTLRPTRYRTSRKGLGLRALRSRGSSMVLYPN